MTNLDTRRHVELFDPEQFYDNINIIGAGATGSWLALQLAKLGVKGDQIKVWDFDEIEPHNIPNQAFRNDQVGEPKTHALQENIHRDTGTMIEVQNEKFTRGRLSGYVFLMVDSMAERKRIWEESIRMKSAIKMLIEPRMGLDMARLYNVEPMSLTQIKQYETTFYTDEEAEVSACGASQTVVTSAMTIASYCARQLINKVSDKEMDNEILIDFIYNNLITERWE